MTAAAGRPALSSTDETPLAAGDVRAGVVGRLPPSRLPPSRLPMVLALARVEASLLLRSVLVLTGLLAGGATIWILMGPAEPLWWNVGWKIGFGQLVLGMAVLIAAHLAAGRPRRNAMADLYASFPASAGTRTLGNLAGLGGAAPVSLVLIGAAVLVIQLRGAIGSSNLTVLAGGLVLVIAAGAAGIAIATRFPHPLAGVLAALTLLLSSGTSHAASGGAIWLLPWEWTQDQLSMLPGPLAGYPPAGAHILELAGLAVLAVAAALLATASRGRARAGLRAAGILALAVICVAGILQLRPIPTAQLNQLVTDVADPVSVQSCTNANQVRYCLYPGFGRHLSSLEAPVNGVLAHVPARPGGPLTVGQVVWPYLLDSTLTHGHPVRQVDRWQAQVQRAPGTAARTSAIYLSVGSWPASGTGQADARFEVALATAQWAAGLAQTVSPNAVSSGTYLTCVPLDQAREAIAIWLAILATHPPPGELHDGLGRSGGFAQVHGTAVPLWAYPGSDVGGYLAPGETGPQTTAAGYLLADAMTRLPVHTVSHVLTGAWSTWLDWRTTDTQLAAALGIPMPQVHAPAATSPGRTAGPGAGNEQSPLCTS